MILVCLLLFLLSIATSTLGQITAAPSCPAQADPWHSQLGLLVQKRDIRTYCDSSSKFYCYQPAACVSGSDGYIGCCTAIGTTCAPRTKCIDYTPGITASCDYVTGGCVYCSEPSLPFCVKAYRHNNYVYSCGTEPLTTTYADTATESPVLAPTDGSASPSAAITTIVQPTQTSSSGNNEASPSSTSMASSVSSALSPSSTSKTVNTSSASDPAQNGSMASSRGLIVGVVIGAAAGSVLFLVLAFILWKCWKHRRSGLRRSSRGNSNKAKYSLGSGEDSIAEHPSSQHDVAHELLNPKGPAELEEQSHRSTDDTPGFNNAHDGTQDVQHSVHNVNAQPYSPEDIRGAAEVPTNTPLWSSPSIAMTSPTPSNSSLWTTPGMGTPKAPSQYVAYTPYTPSSVYSASGQPPSSLPQSKYRGETITQGSPVAELEAHEVGRVQ
ncbi:hypothetical protein QM012_006650 [Aureobasidium pullulans]|uniref:Mid2 domain-containing protein n=1 Tax=Aureobasidium pullulans TaxID=5580 RepID=A0ABR0TP78_AURPU